jgi:PhnB protein
MKTANVYLNFLGNCEEAFNFYKSVFNVDFGYLGRFKDMPKQEGIPELPKELEDKIMHVSLPISKETIIMGSDTGGPWASQFIQGSNFSISINTDDKAEADNLFIDLSEGGNAVMPMNETFWGDYYGSLTDKFGINWMISYNPEAFQSA